MPSKYIPVALVYDFDGTLVPGNMQEHGFIPEIGMGKKDFWNEVTKLTEQHNGDNILMYMNLMLKKAEHSEVKVQKRDFKKYGDSLEFFEGIVEGGKNGWFDRINQYGKDTGVAVKHYIISSGIREMIEGTKIANKFKAIYASSFQYDHHGVAKSPALAINYTSKTQYLFRINKGIDNVYDHSKINQFVEKDERPMPFEQMVFIGDGETDIPCFRLVKEQGGYAIAVYKPKSLRKNADNMKKEGRVNYVVPANYKDGSKLDQIVKTIIDKIQLDHHLIKLG